jgi:hypothetical protein
METTTLEIKICDQLYAYKLPGSIFVKAKDRDFGKVANALGGKLDTLDLPNLVMSLLLRNPRLLGFASYMVAG